MKLSYIKRTTNQESSSFELNDVSNYLKDGDAKILVLKKNPFRQNDNDVFQIFVCDNEDVIASGFHFPTSLVIDGNEIESITCSTLSVNSTHRKQGIGSKIHKLRMEHSQNGAILIGSVSQMQYNIMQKLGAKLFFSPRLLLLKKSRAVVEMFCKGFLAKIVAFICNIFLFIQQQFIKLIAQINGQWKYEIYEVKEIDQEYERIWNGNKERFKENHNKEWAKWVLDSNKDCKLYYIKRKGDVIAWFIIKEQFHKQASQRGFKNVTLRSIIEWETADIKKLSYFKICLFAMTLPGNIDAIEFVPFNKSLYKKMLFLGTVPMGKGNVVLRLSENSPLREIEGINNEKNWRIRPAAGDNMLF